jgi:hypothetical protein
MKAKCHEIESPEAASLHRLPQGGRPTSLKRVAYFSLRVVRDSAPSIAHPRICSPEDF